MATFHVHGGETNSNVVLATFSNANLQHDKGMRFAVLQQKDQSKKQGAEKRKVLIAETASMTYKAKNFGPDAAHEKDLTRYMLGVFDKKTNKVKVYDAETFHLHPYFSDDENGEDEVDNDKTYKEKMDDLTLAFGGAKKKRALESRKRNEIKGSALDAAMDSAVQLSRQRPDNEIAPVVKVHQEASIVLPPHNKDATSPQDAYPLEHLLSTDDLDILKTPAQLFANCDRDTLKEWKANELYSHYIISQLSVLPVAAETRLHKASIIMYLNYLFAVLKLRAPDLKRKEILPEYIPNLIKEKLLNEFTVEGPAIGGKRAIRFMPARMKDKLLVHILVICLIVDNFNLEFSALQADLKIGLFRITKMLRALGCRISNQTIAEMPGMPETVVRIATLPVPLKFPDPSQQRRGSKK